MLFEVMIKHTAFPSSSYNHSELILNDRFWVMMPIHVQKANDGNNTYKFSITSYQSIVQQLTSDGNIRSLFRNEAPMGDTANAT